MGGLLKSKLRGFFLTKKVRQNIIPNVMKLNVKSIALNIGCLLLMSFIEIAMNGSAYAGQEHNQSISCRQKGCLLARESETLVVYFRGHVRGYPGHPGRVPQRFWAASARRVLTKNNYNLQRYKLKASLYATGSSHIGLSVDELLHLLLETRADRLILAAHSGGYVGLHKTLNSLSVELKKKVSGIWLLDNFYSPANTRKHLTRMFSGSFLRSRCLGYTTPHNHLRYQRYFKNICPGVRALPNGYHVRGLQCMEDFANNKKCVPH